MTDDVRAATYDGDTVVVNVCVLVEFFLEFGVTVTRPGSVSYLA